MLNPWRGKPTLDYLNKDFNNTHGEQTDQFDYFMDADNVSAFGGTLSNVPFPQRKAFC